MCGKANAVVHTLINWRTTMSDEKTFQSVAQDAGELMRTEFSGLRDTVSDTVAVGLSTAKSVGEQLLRKVRSGTAQLSRKRRSPAAKPARVARKTGKKAAKRVASAKKTARKVMAKKSSRALSRKRSTKR